MAGTNTVSIEIESDTDTEEEIEIDTNTHNDHPMKTSKDHQITLCKFSKSRDINYKHKLLVMGYINKHSSKFIPMDLILLIQKFYDVPLDDVALQIQRIFRPRIVRIMDTLRLSGLCSPWDEIAIESKTASFGRMCCLLSRQAFWLWIQMLSTVPIIIYEFAVHWRMHQFCRPVSGIFDIIMIDKAVAGLLAVVVTLVISRIVKRIKEPGFCIMIGNGRLVFPNFIDYKWVKIGYYCNIATIVMISSAFFVLLFFAPWYEIFIFPWLAVIFAWSPCCFSPELREETVTRIKSWQKVQWTVYEESNTFISTALRILVILIFIGICILISICR